MRICESWRNNFQETKKLIVFFFFFLLFLDKFKDFHMLDGSQQGKFKDTLQNILANNNIGNIKIGVLDNDPQYKVNYVLNYNLNDSSNVNKPNITFFKDIMDALLKNPAETRNCLKKDCNIILGGGNEHILRYDQNTGNLTLLMNGIVANDMIIEKKTNLHLLVNNPYLARKYGNEKMDKYTFYLENHQIDINNWPKNIIPSLYQTGGALVLYDTITKETLIIGKNGIDKNTNVFYSNFLRLVCNSLKRSSKLDNLTVLKTISDLCNRRNFFKSSFQNTICNIQQYYFYPNYCVWKPINSNKDIDITVDFYNGNPRFVL